MSGKIYYWQEQLTLYINWHHAVSDIFQLKTLKSVLEGLVIFDTSSHFTYRQLTVIQTYNLQVLVQISRC